MTQPAAIKEYHAKYIFKKETAQQQQQPLPSHLRAIRTKPTSKDLKPNNFTTASIQGTQVSV